MDLSSTIATRENQDKLGDWRLMAVTTLEKDLQAIKEGDPVYPAGSLVTTTVAALNSSGGLTSFFAPSTAAISLNVAMTASREAENLRKVLLTEFTADGMNLSLKQEFTSSLFDYFEKCIVACTFSFLAIEAFCNHEIGRKASIDKLVEVAPKKGRREWKTLVEIERHTSTEDKLKIILPLIFNEPSPAGFAIWTEFQELQEFRDQITHFKSHSQYPRHLDGNIPLVGDTFWFRILDRDMTKFPLTTVKVMRWFYKSKEQSPRWLKIVSGEVNYKEEK